MTWERGNLLKSYKGATYEHNADGLRTSKTADGTTTRYLTDGVKLLSERKQTDTALGYTYYIYDDVGLTGFVNDRNLGTSSHTRTAYQVVTDTFGTVHEIRSVNTDNTPVARYLYDAWGKCTVCKPDGLVDTNMSSVGNVFPFRWKGYYWDADMQMYYVNGRWYDPDTGRFISPDYENSVLTGESPYAMINPVAYQPHSFTWASCLPLVAENKTRKPSKFGNWLNSMPNWAKWTIGAGAIIILAGATVLTAGLSNIAIGSALGAGFGATLMTTAGVAATGAAATAVGILSAATAGAVIGAGFGAIAGGISGGWDGAANGFAIGAVTGGITGAASQGLSLLPQFGANAAKAGLLSAGAKFGYGVLNFGIQIVGNAAVNTTLSIAQQAIFTGQIDWAKVGVAAFFGRATGAAYLLKGPWMALSAFGLTGAEEFLGLFI